MSSSAPSKRLFPPNSLPPGKDLSTWLTPLVESTVGAKFIVALTGWGLTLFVISHLIGNLKIFAGQDSINSYAAFLKNLGPLLWLARIGLLAIFLLHIVLTIRLKWRSRQARPVPYSYKATVHASIASRTMLTTGLVIFAFVLYHLAHFTFGWVATAGAIDPQTGSYVRANYLDLVDAQGRPDVYSMVVSGFRNPIIALIYIAAQIAVFAHLSHGVSSAFQSLGLNAPRFQRTIKAFGYAVALFVSAGNIFIIVAVWAGWVPVAQSFVRVAHGGV